ncbi:single-stranded DNA-binding protein [Pasteurella atlantica]|uniref:single-stranded DNA-binding protein n=1 Tax=Pasteurellaceae TaxID=712 RepID=UPI001B817FD9|nr:single-stranded DNA-binding protein [Pasteurella atlantica]MBR0573823.1 single-stranded DNA-binding protein [Pasteurella atlantica]MDP8039759.1 single-stranded DNA-binding protein [Pasteurella atlantica]MDP8041944.1 single-stranded DNA-binding protein [Pasteurella atlantica]MDP8044031.1 single-stranded DNA-binding protein [Pasteurella atlantica]MDP8046009.1 single-stranded DNA-binding protein [Pasteurella atlantica]
MAKSLNSVQIIGNLGAEPDVLTLSNGDIVTTISVATTERWIDKETNETKERTDWHRISAFKGNAEICKKYLHKGSSVFIQGSIRYESWEDKETGETKYSTKIIANNIILLDRNQTNQSPSLNT